MRDPQTGLALLTLAATLTLLPWVTGVVHVVCESSWYGGFHGEVRFNINQTLTDWQVHITFKVPVDHIETWDSNVQKISDYDFLVTPKDYDRVFNPGDTLAVSFNGFTPGVDLSPAICAYIVGYDADWVCPRDGITAPPTPATTADPCLAMNCGPGHCVIQPGSTTPTCDCTDTGYTGDHCEINPCLNYDCGNGTCEAHGSRAATATCNCSDTGYMGDHCQTSLCEQYDCGNGTCSLDQAHHPICDCKSTGFNGKHCNESPCQVYQCGTGRCVVAAGDVATATCDCVGTNFNGDHCEVNPCSSFTCGTGRCVVAAGQTATASCDCTNTRFNGDHCEVDPCTAFTCGTGRCVVTAGQTATASCDCKQTLFNGDHCEVDPCQGYQCGTGRCVVIPGDVATPSCDCGGTGFTGDHCEVNPCDTYQCGPGQCIVNRMTAVPSCNCTGTGFNGDHCEIDPCATEDCGSGICVRTGFPAIGVCQCSGSGSTGPYCQLDRCTALDCHTGTCVHPPGDLDNVFCNCSFTGYNGPNCDVPPCAAYDCGHGTCVTIAGQVATATCNCTGSGYNGPTCTVDPCATQSCDHGVCVRSTTTNPAVGSCSCTGTGFSGAQCEVDLCDSLDCGPGHCVHDTSNPDHVSCDCSGTGFNGDHCTEDPCSAVNCGTGRCEKSGSPAVAVCNCVGTGFSGTTCDVDRCTTLTCGPGHCEHTPGNLDQVYCNCSHTGFNGAHCDVDPCASLTCQHGGQCSKSGTPSLAYCVCTGTGFVGTLCDVDRCTRLDCGPGSCSHSQRNADFVGCNCSYSGFTGQHCEVNPCATMNCGHGVCVASHSMVALASCDCSGSGYNGIHCELDPCAGYDCGPGKCLRSGDGPFVAVCNCTDTGYYGDHCDISIVKNFTEALSLSQLFYYAQRSGKLPANNPIPWRHDSALNDCIAGGWYDAGDHVKFTFPMASALTVLLWGGDRFKEGYTAAGELDTFYDTVKWGLDYLLAAWNPFSQELTVQVGDGDVDHQFWGRPEDMTMARPCFKVLLGANGSDVAAEVAAALAAGAMVFKDKGDFAYAFNLLQTAESVFLFAKENRGLYSDIPSLASKPYYRSTNDSDEMCQAAVWLYKATLDDNYLDLAKAEAPATLPEAYDWNDKTAACQLLLYEETGTSSYMREVQRFLDSWKPGGDKIYTPCGFAWGNATYWGSARHVSNVAFLGLLAAEDGIDTDQNRKWAAEQLNYLLGDNPHDGGCFSYEIGYGAKYALRPHHRAASCSNPPQQCSEAVNLHTDLPSPHILYGGLVGGPIQNDGYNDSREDYVHNEVALDYNSGFQSAVAGASKLVHAGEWPKTSNLCPCHDRVAAPTTASPIHTTHPHTTHPHTTHTTPVHTGGPATTVNVATVSGP